GTKCSRRTPRRVAGAEREGGRCAANSPRGLAGGRARQATSSDIPPLARAPVDGTARGRAAESPRGLIRGGFVVRRCAAAARRPAFRCVAERQLVCGGNLERKFPCAVPSLCLSRIPQMNLGFRHGVCAISLENPAF